MKLSKKKELAARTLNVGKERIIFNTDRLAEIKEAITKQDIKDLYANKAILIKEIKGRKKVVKRTTRKRAGSKKKIVRKKKRSYMLLIRKLREHIVLLKRKNSLALDDYRTLRKEVKAKTFETLAELKERIQGIGQSGKAKIREANK